VGACVGVRGSRIKNIVDELGGEKIDIVRWNESSQILISNALKPAEVAEVALCFELGRATVVVNEDQLSLAIGKRGQNVRLAARLTGWDVDILTPPEFQAGVQRLDQTLKQIPGITQEHVDKVIALGLIDVRDLEEVGSGPLMEDVGLDEATAETLITRCSEEAKIVAVEQVAKKAADAAARAADRKALASAGLLGGGLGGSSAKADSDGSAANAQAFANPLLPQTPETVVKQEDENGELGDRELGGASRTPDAMQATDGIAPELVTHADKSFAGASELSPEERAIHGVGIAEEDAERKEFADEDGNAAALAEGRVDPPLA
jgi:N utilization substance protein A